MYLIPFNPFSMWHTGFNASSSFISIYQCVLLITLPSLHKLRPVVEWQWSFIVHADSSHEQTSLDWATCSCSDLWHSVAVIKQVVFGKNKLVLGFVSWLSGQWDGWSGILPGGSLALMCSTVEWSLQGVAFLFPIPCWDSVCTDSGLHDL